MSDNELEKIRQRKLEMLMKRQTVPKSVIDIHSEADLHKLTSDFPDKIVIIDFWAEWCSPCKMFAPTFEKLQQEYYQDFFFAKINVDENPVIAQKFSVSSIPTTIFISSGKLLRKIVGAMNYGALKQVLEKLKS